MQSDTKIRVGIIRGMAGDHYESSLQRGGEILAHIAEHLSDKYKPLDILVDKNYIWHLGGVPITPGDLLQRIDVAWNASHPSVANILESLSIPHIGGTTFLHILENNKDLFREHLKNLGVAMPRHIVLPVYQEDFDGPREKYASKAARKVFEKFSSPWIVRSFTPDPNAGVHLAKTYPELISAIEDCLNHGKSILVEELIPGKVASVHSVAGLRGEPIYAFPPTNVFGNISSEEKESLLNLAKRLHGHLGGKHYLKCTFVVDKRGKVYLLDAQSMPNLKPDSSLHAACEAVGTKAHHVIHHILEHALS